MVPILITLAMVAVAAAIGAAYRVADRHAAQRQATALPAATLTATQSGAVREAESTAGQKPMPQPDRDTAFGQAEMSGSTAAGMISSVIAMPSDVDIPLAASLPVSELVQPEGSATTPQMDATLATSQADGEHQPVLAEIAALGRSGQLSEIEQLTQHIHHPDSTVRVAVAFALGELGARQPHQEEAIVGLLSQLSEDVDPQVRVQAVAALGRMPSSIAQSASPEEPSLHS